MKRAKRAANKATKPAEIRKNAKSGVKEPQIPSVTSATVAPRTRSK